MPRNLRKNKKKPLFFNCMNFLSWLIITDYLQVAILISATPYSDFKVIQRRFPQWKCRQGTGLLSHTNRKWEGTSKSEEKKPAEAIVLIAAYSTQDRQIIKCKETKTRSESSLHTTNWCSKTIIQMFLTIFCQLFSKDFFLSYYNVDFPWKIGTAMTISNQVCSLFENTLETRTKFAVEKRRDW